MKQILFFCLYFLSVNSVYSQITAVTSNGDQVILNSDGTWKYLSDSAGSAEKIDTSKNIFTKSSNASFLVKSNKVNCGVYINPKKWSFSKSKSTEASEYSFTLKDKDAYAMMITEKIQISYEDLKSIALENAREVAPDIRIAKQEYRKVNGNYILLLQMDGTIHGIKFNYIGYYSATENGTVQLICYTSNNLFNQNKPDFEEFLNGFTSTD